MATDAASWVARSRMLVMKLGTRSMRRPDLVNPRAAGAAFDAVKGSISYFAGTSYLLSEPL